MFRELGVADGFEIEAAFFGGSVVTIGAIAGYKSLEGRGDRRIGALCRTRAIQSQACE